MTERKWLPAAWLDEVPPTSGYSPDDFLLRGPEDVLFLSPIDPPEDHADTWPCPERLQPGQQVQFCWYEDRGWIELVMSEDGTWRLDPPWDGEVNCITDDEHDIIAFSVDDYIKQQSEFLGADEKLSGRINLWGWYWSDGQYFRVRVLESGAANFEPVPSEHFEPCPFCGAVDPDVAECMFSDEDMIESGWSQSTFFQVTCSCGAAHGDYPGHKTREVAIASWNTRTGGASQ